MCTFDFRIKIFAARPELSLKYNEQVLFILGWGGKVGVAMKTQSAMETGLANHDVHNIH